MDRWSNKENNRILARHVWVERKKKKVQNSKLELTIYWLYIITQVYVWYYDKYDKNTNSVIFRDTSLKKNGISYQMRFRSILS